MSLAIPQATPDVRSRLLNVRYAEKDYWDNRYKTQSCEFDWFYGYTALRKLVRSFVKRSKPVLHVGCGNSNFQEGMALDGYQVMNTDISEVVIEQMRAKHRDMPGLGYVVSDCRNMPEFLDCQFGSVIDKGTVDALLCSKDAGDNITRMFREISRVLVPGGTFLLITLGGPSQRLALVNRPEFGWSVQVCLVRRVPDGQFAPSAPGRAIPLNDTLRPLSFIGPLPVQPDGTMDGLPEPFDPAAFFYAYACRKAPLVLRRDNSAAAGSKVRLPDGWRAAVRVVAEVIGGEMGLPRGILDRGRRVNITSRASFERKQRERELQLQQHHQVEQQHHMREAEGADAQAPGRPASAGTDGRHSSGSGVEECSAARAPRPQEQHRRVHASSGGGHGRHANDHEACPQAAGCASDLDGGSNRSSFEGANAADAGGCVRSDRDSAGANGAPHSNDPPLPCSRSPSPPPLPSVGHPPGCQQEAQQAEADAGQSCEAAPLPVPRPAPRAGSDLMARTINYSRLSNSVKDAFAQLDAVDGDGHTSCEDLGGGEGVRKVDA